MKIKLFFILFILFSPLIKAYAATCTPPISGNYTPSSSCSFGATVDGVDGGSGDINTAILTVPSGVTITIQANQTIAFGSISLAGGSIALNATGALKTGPLWVRNQDGDPYPYQANPPYTMLYSSGYSRRDILATTSVADCNDTIYNATNQCSPYAPTGLAATAASSSQINLSWTAPSTDASHTAPSSYNIYYCSGSSCSPSTLLASTTSTSYSNTGLASGTTYGYYVIAVNSAGNSSPSNTAYATTPLPYCNSGAVWSACSVSCGGGTQTCTYTTYTGGGSCTQTSCGSQSCNTQSCCTNVYCYADNDHDGYGAGSAYLFCTIGGTCPSGYVTNNSDCCDSDANAHPGQTSCFTSPDACGSFDYNCNGSVSVCNAGGGNYYCNYGGAVAASYYNGSSCTNGTYSGFYASTCSTTSANCGQTQPIQPCSYTYYSGSNCSVSVYGYNVCTSRTFSCN